MQRRGRLSERTAGRSQLGRCHAAWWAQKARSSHSGGEGVTVVVEGATSVDPQWMITCAMTERAVKDGAVGGNSNPSTVILPVIDMVPDLLASVDEVMNSHQAQKLV